MKLNRLLEITTILLNKKTVTAGELAERFGVSTRTIYRDIDVLSASGVPVYSTQGTNGGISILDDYTVSRAILSGEEKDSILLALKTLQATQYPEIDTILEKLGSLFRNSVTDWISVDFTPWGATPDSDNRFSLIKEAIMRARVIEVDYINSFNSKSHRKIEPLRLIFKSRAWYLWGYCLAKQDYRTFRISRIKNVAVTEEAFDRSQVHITDEKASELDLRRPPVHIVLEFSREAMYRLCDDYDDDMLVPCGNGAYRIEIDYPEDEWVYGYILSFGSYVRVIEPEHIKRIIKEKSKKILSYYE